MRQGGATECAAVTDHFVFGLSVVAEMQPKNLLAVRCSVFDKDEGTFTVVLQLGPYPGWHFALALIAKTITGEGASATREFFGGSDKVWQVLMDFDDREGRAWLSCEYESIARLAEQQLEKLLSETQSTTE